MTAHARLALAMLAATLSACASDTLSERDARTVEVGQVLATSYTAAIRGSQVHVVVPSGRVDLTLSKPVAAIAAADAIEARPLRAREGAVAVGVAWSLNRGALPDASNRQLTGPATIFGVPKPVRLWLVTDGTRREIPDAATLETPQGRPRNAAWLIVPAGVRQWRFEIDYDGVTQSVDARTGKVAPGRAAALYKPLPLDHTDSCDLGDGDVYYTSCLLKYAIGYPYVDGAGWAPNGKTFALVRLSVGSNLDGGSNVRVAGVAASATVGNGETFRAYIVSPARAYSIRGTGQAESVDGKTRTLPLTGSLDNSEAA